MSEYAERFSAAQSELEDAGIWRANATPPYIHALLALGYQPRPPHYLPFWRAVAGHGIFFSIAWGLTMALTEWSYANQPIMKMISTSVTGGVIFGVGMAIYYHHGKRRHSLSRWENLVAKTNTKPRG